RNSNAKASASAAKAGSGDLEALRAHGVAIKAALAEVEGQLAAASEAVLAASLALPNWTAPGVPVGPESAAVHVRSVGPPPSPMQHVRDHEDICSDLGLLDLAAGAAVAGPRFACLTGDGVLLEQALVSFALQRAASAGFHLHAPPDLAHVHAVEACGFHPRGEASQVYTVEGTDLCLIGTAEIPLMAMNAGKLFAAAQLPLRMAAVSHCFRREAGGGGAASRGLYRLHQFSKVELAVVCAEDASEQVLEELLDLQCSIVEELGLHARVLDMPTEELGASAARKYDIEAWMPGRFGMRYRHGHKDNRFAHTLNGTALAVPRVMLALLETHQLPDGRVQVPPALRPFLGGREHLGAAEER
ncbi:OVA7, partial [Symbiodinium sp. KB8]